MALLHLDHGLQDGVDGAVGGHAGGNRCNLGFNQAPCGQYLERAWAHFRQVGWRRALADIHAGAAAHFDHAAQFERDQRFAQRGAADTELGGEIAFGRQAFAGGDIFGADQVLDAVGHHAVEARFMDLRVGECGSSLLHHCLVFLGMALGIISLPFGQAILRWSDQIGQRGLAKYFFRWHTQSVK